MGSHEINALALDAAVSVAKSANGTFVDVLPLAEAFRDFLNSAPAPKLPPAPKFKD